MERDQAGGLQGALGTTHIVVSDQVVEITAPRGSAARVFGFTTRQLGGPPGASTPWVAAENTAQRMLADRNVTEHLRISADGAELTWVVNARPSDDLPMAFEVDFGPEVDAIPTTRGLALHINGIRGQVIVGNALAVDSVGHRANVPVRWERGAARYELSASFLRDGVYPIALDPVIGPPVVVDEPWIYDSPGYSLSVASLPTGQSLASWAQLRGGMTGVFATRLAATGSLVDPLGLPLARELPNIPRAASVHALGGNYLVVWPSFRSTDVLAARVSSEGVVLDTSPLLIADGDNVLHRMACAQTHCMVIRRVVSTGVLQAQLIGVDGLMGASVPLGSAAVGASVAVDTSSDHAVVLWHVASDPRRVSGTRLQRGGSAWLATPFELDLGTSEARDVEVAVLPQERFVIALSRYVPGDPVPGRFVSYSFRLLAEPTIGAFSNALVAEDSWNIQVAPASSGAVIAAGAAGGALKLVRVSPSSAPSSPLSLGTDVDVDAILSQIALTPVSTTSGFTHWVGWSQRAPQGPFPGRYDVRLQAVNADTSVSPVGPLLDPTTSTADVQRVVLAANDSRFLILWEHPTNAGSRVAGTIVDAAGTVLTPSGVELPTASLLQTSPKAAAHPLGFLVVCAESGATGNQAVSRVVTFGGATLPGQVVSTGPLHARPFIGLAADTSGYVATWRNALGTLEAVALDSDGIRTGNVLTLGVATSASEPALAGEDGSFLAVYARGNSAGTNHDLHAVRLSTSGGPLTASPQLTLAAGQLREMRPGVASLRGDFLVTWLVPTQGIEGIDPGAGLSGWRLDGAIVTADGSTAPVAGIAPEGLVLQAPVLASTFEQYFVAWPRLRTDWKYDMQGRAVSPGGLFDATPVINLLSLNEGAFTHDVTYSGSGREFLLAYSSFVHDPGAGVSGTRVFARFVTLDAPDFDSDGYSYVAGDCDDNRANVYPGAPELCDGLDNDCDVLVDEGFETPEIVLSSNQTLDCAVSGSPFATANPGDEPVVRLASGAEGVTIRNCTLSNRVGAITLDAARNVTMQHLTFVPRAVTCGGVGNSSGVIAGSYEGAVTLDDVSIVANPNSASSWSYWAVQLFAGADASLTVRDSSFEAGSGLRSYSSGELLVERTRFQSSYLASTTDGIAGLDVLAINAVVADSSFDSYADYCAWLAVASLDFSGSSFSGCEVALRSDGSGGGYVYLNDFGSRTVTGPAQLFDSRAGATSGMGNYWSGQCTGGGFVPGAFFTANAVADDHPFGNPVSAFAPRIRAGAVSIAAPGCDDGDGDGRTDLLDNCPEIPNADQTDVDGDGEGDLCEGCFGAPADGDNDGYIGDNACPVRDCGPSNPLVHPDASELCDGLDNDCDGVVDDNCIAPLEASIAIQAPLQDTYTSPFDVVVVASNATNAELSSVAVVLDGVDITAQLSRTGAELRGVLSAGEGSHVLSATLARRGGGQASATATFAISPTLAIAGLSRTVQAGTNADALEDTDPTRQFREERFPTGLGKPANSGDLPYSFIYDHQSLRADETLALIATSDDIAFKGRAGLDFVLRRTYSSDDAIAKRAKARMDLALQQAYNFVANNIVFIPQDHAALAAMIAGAASLQCGIVAGNGGGVTCSTIAATAKVLYDTGQISLRHYAELIRDIDEVPALWFGVFRQCRPQDYDITTTEGEIRHPEIRTYAPGTEPAGYICGYGAEIVAEHVLQVLEERDVEASNFGALYGELASQAGWSRHYEIRSGLGQGWSLNLPFIEFPSAGGDRPGHVWFEGRRPKQFTNLGAAVFSHEGALLWALTGSPQPAGTTPCAAGQVTRECLVHELGEGNLIVQGERPTIPALGGQVRPDLEYRLLVRDTFYYFDAWGRPRIVTDASHNNVIEIVWTANASSNEDALSNSRIDFIVDTVGNRFDFTYYTDAEIEALRQAFAARYGSPSSATGVVYADQAPPTNPPLIKNVSGPSLRVAYRYEAIPQPDQFGDAYVPEQGAETWVLAGVEVFAASSRGLSATNRVAAYEYAYENLRYFDCASFTSASSGRFVCGRRLTNGANSVIVPIKEHVPLLTAQRGPALESAIVVYDAYELLEGGGSQGVALANVTGQAAETFLTGAGLYSFSSRPTVSSVEEAAATNRQGGAPWASPSRQRVEHYVTNLPSRGDVPEVVFIKRQVGGFINGAQRHFNTRYLEKANGGWRVTREEDRWGTDESTATLVKSRTYTYDALDRVTRLDEKDNSLAAAYLFDASHNTLRQTYDAPDLAVVSLDGSTAAHTSVTTVFRDDYPWLLKQRTVSADIVTSTRFDYGDELARTTCLQSTDPALSLRPVAAVFQGPERYEVTCVAYDTYGNATRAEMPDGSYVVMNYDAPEIATTYLEPDVFLATVERDIQGQRRTAFQATDFAGDVIRRVDESGRIFTTERDGVGRVTRLADPEFVTSIAYGSSTTPWNVSPELLNPPTSSWAQVFSGAQTIYAFRSAAAASGDFNFLRKNADYHGRLGGFQHFRPSDPLAPGATTFVLDTMGYNGNGKLESFRIGSGGSAKDWLMHYDMFDRPVQMATPTRSTAGTQAGLATEVNEAWSYDDNYVERTEIGRRAYLAARTTIDGTIRLYSDPLGQVVARAQDVKLDPTDEQTTTLIHRFTWTRRGLMQSATAPNGDFVSFQYDSHGAMTRRVRGQAGQTNCPRDEVTIGGCIEETWHSDHAGRVDRYTDGAGRTSTFTYDGSGNMRSAIDPAGRVTSFDSDERGKMTSRCFVNACETWAYGPRGDLLTSTDRDGFAFTYEHDYFHQVTATTDVSRNATRVSRYDVFGNRVLSLDEAGHAWRSAYDGAGRLVSTSEPRGAVADRSFVTNRYGDVLEMNTPAAPALATSYSRDVFGRVTRKRSTIDVATDYTYNGFGQVATRRELPRDVTWAYIYDVRGRLAATRSPENRWVSAGYDFANRPVRQTRGQEVWEYGYDAKSRIATQTTPNGGVTTLRYNILDLIASVGRTGISPTVFTYVDDQGAADLSGRNVLVTDGASDWVRSKKSARGDMLKRSNSAGDVETFTYDSQHHPITHVRSNTGAPTVVSSETRVYSPDQRLQSVTFENATSRSFGYDASGNLTSVTDEMGLLSTWAYDSPLTTPTEHKPAGAPLTRYTYDAVGRPRTSRVEAGAASRTSTTAYDDLLGTTTRTPSGRGSWVYGFSPDGNVQSLRTPTSGATVKTFSYDAANRLAEVLDEIDNRTVYSYDAMGNVTRVHVNGAQNGDVRAYDSYGRLATAVSAQGTATYNYRPTDGRLAEITHPDGSASRFDYASNKLLAQRVEANTSGSTIASKTFDYDYQQLLSSLEETVSGITKRVDYRRDTRGRVRAEVVSGASSSINDADYYANGLLKRVNTTHYDRSPTTGLVTAVRTAARSGDFAVYGVPALAPDAAYPTLTLTRNGFAEPEALSSTAGLAVAWTHDAAGALQSVTTPHNQRTIAYWPDGTIASIALTEGASSSSETFAYTAGRLTRATGPELGDLTYGYNGAGSLTQVRDTATGAVVESRTYDWSNRLLSVTAQGQTRSVQYDGRGRVAQVGSGGTARGYTHDAFGRLTQTRLGAATTQTFSYDAADRLLSDVNVATSRSRSLEHFGVLPTRMVDDGQASSLVSDPASGDPFAAYGGGLQHVALGVGQRLVEELDGTGASVGGQTLGPYGARLSGAPVHVPFGFQGYYEHIDSDLKRSYARTYDGALATFTSPDPLSGTMTWPASMNRWRAFSGDPVNVRDVFGLQDAPSERPPDEGLSIRDLITYYGGQASGPVGVAAAAGYFIATNWNELFGPGTWGAAAARDVGQAFEDFGNYFFGAPPNWGARYADTQQSIPSFTAPLASVAGDPLGAPAPQSAWASLPPVDRTGFPDGTRFTNERIITWDDDDTGDVYANNVANVIEPGGNRYTVAGDPYCISCFPRDASYGAYEPSPLVRAPFDTQWVWSDQWLYSDFPIKEDVVGNIGAAVIGGWVYSGLRAAGSVIVDRVSSYLATRAAITGAEVAFGDAGAGAMQAGIDAAVGDVAGAAVGNSATGIAGTSLFNVVNVGEGFSEIATLTAAGEVRVLTEMIRNGATLILRGAEIEGPGAGSLGVRGLRELIRNFGREQGVEKVVIEGARRSTGANPGHVPRSIEILVE